MKKKLFPLILLLSIIIYRWSYSQEKDSVVILSSKVGAIITNDEKEYYKIFSATENCNYSIIYKSGASRYYIKFCLVREGMLKDTIINCSEQTLLNLAEKINNFEALVKGSYKMGTNPAEITLIGKDSINKIEFGIRETITGEQKNKIWSDRIFLPDNDDIPFSDSVELNKTKTRINRTFYKFGFGVSSYSPDISGVNSAFTIIEDFYRDKGYPISNHSLDYSFNVLLLYRVSLLLSERFNIALNAAKAVRTDNKFYYIGASGIYYCILNDIKWLKPFADLELSYNYFRMRKFYGDRISPVSNSGSYDFLDYIEASGSGFGLSLKTGITLESNENISFDIFIKYHYIPKMEADIKSGYRSVNAVSKPDSFIFGVMLCVAY
jgi:hypothetical protein